MDQKALEDFVKSYTKSMDVIADHIAQSINNKAESSWKDWILAVVALATAAMIATIWDMRTDLRGLTEKVTYQWTQINKNTGCVERIDKILTEHVAMEKARREHKK